jgi:hypothetical protein
MIYVPKKISFPSDEELKERYADLMANEAVRAISEWAEPNTDEPCDEGKYLECALGENADALHRTIDEVFPS